MVLSTKKKRKPLKARIPSEVIALESILKTGRIRFRCHWQIYDFGSAGAEKRTPAWQQIRSKIWNFTAGSMEELLAAVHSAVLAAHSTPGVRLEGSWRKWCPRCGRLMSVAGGHKCPMESIQGVDVSAE